MLIYIYIYVEVSYYNVPTYPDLRGHTRRHIIQNINPSVFGCSGDGAYRFASSKVFHFYGVSFNFPKLNKRSVITIDKVKVFKQINNHLTHSKRINNNILKMFLVSGNSSAL